MEETNRWLAIAFQAEGIASHPPLRCVRWERHKYDEADQPVVTPVSLSSRLDELGIGVNSGVCLLFSMDRFPLWADLDQHPAMVRSPTTGKRLSEEEEYSSVREAIARWESEIGTYKWWIGTDCGPPGIRYPLMQALAVAIGRLTAGVIEPIDFLDTDIPVSVDEFIYRYFGPGEPKTSYGQMCLREVKREFREYLRLLMERHGGWA